MGNSVSYEVFFLFSRDGLISCGGGWQLVLRRICIRYTMVNKDLKSGYCSYCFDGDGNGIHRNHLSQCKVEAECLPT